jgi:hypothetical protein
MIGRCRDLEFAGTNVTTFMIVTPHFVHSILSGFGFTGSFFCFITLAEIDHAFTP